MVIESSDFKKKPKKEKKFEILCGEEKCIFVSCLSKIPLTQL